MKFETVKEDIKVSDDGNRYNYYKVYEIDGKYYMFDYARVVFSGQVVVNETMGFNSDKDGNVDDWSELYCCYGDGVAGDVAVKEFIERQVNDND